MKIPPSSVKKDLWPSCVRFLCCPKERGEREREREGGERGKGRGALGRARALICMCVCGVCVEGGRCA